MLRPEVHMSLLEVFFTYGFWQIMKFAWGVPAILIYLTIKGLQCLD